MHIDVVDEGETRSLSGSGMEERNGKDTEELS